MQRVKELSCNAICVGGWVVEEHAVEIYDLKERENLVEYFNFSKIFKNDNYLKMSSR